MLLLVQLVRDASHTFANVEYATTQIPTYPAGQIGLLLCSKATGKRGTPSCVTPARKVSAKDADKYKYYTSALHSAAFVLPRFVQKRVDEAKALVTMQKKELAKKRKSGAAAAEEPEPKVAKAEEAEAEAAQE